MLHSKWREIIKRNETKQQQQNVYGCFDIVIIFFDFAINFFYLFIRICTHTHAYINTLNCAISFFVPAFLLFQIWWYYCCCYCQNNKPPAAGEKKTMNSVVGGVQFVVIVSMLSTKLCVICFCFRQKVDKMDLTKCHTVIKWCNKFLPPAEILCHNRIYRWNFFLLQFIAVQKKECHFWKIMKKKTKKQNEKLFNQTNEHDKRIIKFMCVMMNDNICFIQSRLWQIGTAGN